MGSATTATYTYGNALVRKDGETPLFDGLGSERTVTNTVGAVQGTLTTTAFGQPVASTGGSTDPYEFAATSGYRNDGDAGLTLDSARYYDAQVGMFISRDTVLTQKPYAYCDGNPVNRLDPNGHEWYDGWIDGGGWIASLGGVCLIIPGAEPAGPPLIVVGFIINTVGMIGKYLGPFPSPPVSSPVSPPWCGTNPINQHSARLV